MKYLFFSLFVFAIVSCSNEQYWQSEVDKARNENAQLAQRLQALEQQVAQPQPSKSISNLSSFKDSTSYALGADLGENLRRQNVDIDYDVFMAGLTDGMETGLIKLDQKQRREVMATLQKKLREKADSEGINNLKLADEFLKNNKEKDNIKETPTGLQYRVIKEGEGASPKREDRVKVHYVGKLMDGTEFDSSRKRGEPSEFGLMQVIKGWTEGLQLMRLGAKYEFFIHPKIAYGSRPRPTIPANSLLIFEVELLDIISK